MATATWNKCRRTSSDQSSPRAAGRRTRNAFFRPASPTSSLSPSPPRRRDAFRSLVINAVRPPRTDAVTEYRGVRYREELNKYVTEIRPARSSKKIWLGTYDTAEEAARAFDIGNLCCKKNLPLNFSDSPRMLKRISSQLSPDEARSAIAKLAKEVARVVISSTSDGETIKRKEVDRAAALKAHELVQKKVEEPLPASEFQACHLETAASSVTYTEQLQENIFVFEGDDTATAMPLTEGGPGGHSCSFDLSQVFLNDDLAGIPCLGIEAPNFDEDNHGNHVTISGNGGYGKFRGLGFHGIEEVAMVAGTGFRGLYRAMVSGGMLRQCRSSCASFLAFSRCPSASCPPCASLPSTSQAASDSFRTFSSSSSRGVFGCGSGSVAGNCEDAGLKSNRASVEAIGHAGWCCTTHWTERLCKNFTQTHEMRKSLSTSFDHQNGPVWFARSRASPTMQSQGIRNLSGSATMEEHRQGRRESTDSDLQMEHAEEEDLDYYMKSRYDQESLKSSDTESETESEEELSAECVQSEEPVEDLLWKLKANDIGKFDNVVAVLGDPRVLAAAHERLNERRRNWTLASNELEVSHVPKDNRLLRSREIDYNWFKEAAYQLRTGSYSFKPVKRVDIARRGRGEARQWVFVRPKDQVIQEAIRGILEKIYDPIFSVHDSGFRPGTSVHSALKSVKYGWKGISWFLQFDVRITDHSSVQKRLLKLLAEQIDDEVFLGALEQMFKLGTIWIDTNAEEDKPEGSVLSPMLGNIYFHHLDLEISRIKEEMRSGSYA